MNDVPGSIHATHRKSAGIDMSGKMQPDMKTFGMKRNNQQMIATSSCRSTSEAINRPKAIELTANSRLSAKKSIGLPAIWI